MGARGEAVEDEGREPGAVGALGRELAVEAAGPGQRQIGREILQIGDLRLEGE